VHCWHRYDNDISSLINANTSQCYSVTNEKYEPSPLGTLSTLSDPLWYLDSGVTHHITNDSNAFTKKTGYHGNDVVKLGNGLGMMIANVGNATYLLPSNNTVIHLNNFLHVSDITKNLLSVSKFAKDNNVFF